MRPPWLRALGLSSVLVASSAAGETIRVERDRDGVHTLSNKPGKKNQRSSTPSATARAGSRRSRATLRKTPFAILIEHHARRSALDPNLVRAVIQVESDFDPLAVSVKGAQGLMQLMPDTARELRVEDVWDPDENIRGGTTYLRQQLDRFGRIDLALAAYNAGPGAVERYRRIPPYRDTQDYVAEVLRLYRDGGGFFSSGTRPVVVKRGPDNVPMLSTPQR